MKYSLNFIALLFILASCTYQKKSTAKVPIKDPVIGTAVATTTPIVLSAQTYTVHDTTPTVYMRKAMLQDPAARRKTPPPVGLQNETGATPRTAARALVVPGGEVRNILLNKDTQVIVTTAKNFSYSETDITIRKYVPPVTPPVNVAPVANAGLDKVITLPTNGVTLAGVGIDNEGTIASYLWSKVAGANATIAAPNASTTNVSGLAQGEYTFRLAVKDNGGLTGTDDVKVTVNLAAPSSGYLNLPLSAPMDLSGKSNILVQGLRFDNAPSIAIKMYAGANNITIRNCFFNGAAQELVELENAYNITIENCLFARGYSGVYAAGSKNIKIINCQFVNMRIKWINGNFSGKGQFAQFNSCDQILVENCKGENFPEADPEDMLSFYQSSNAVVRNNVFRGNPTSAWSTSGGGIIIGDNGGSNITIENNTVVTPGNYGMACAGGSGMTIRNNKIYSDRNAVSNNPLYVWAQAGAACSNVTVSSNRVSWIDKNGTRNNGWNAGNCSNTVFEAPTNITLAEMAVPVHLIDMVTPDDLLKIRKPL